MPARATILYAAFEDKRAFAFRTEDVRRLLIKSAELSQSPDFITLEIMHGGLAVLQPVDMEFRLIQIDLVPLKIDDLTDTQAMPVGHEYKKSVTCTVPAQAFGSLDQLIDLGNGQIFARSFFNISPLDRGAGRSFLELYRKR